MKNGRELPRFGVQKCNWQERSSWWCESAAHHMVKISQNQQSRKWYYLLNVSVERLA